MKSHRTLLLCFIHGFKGDDDTFASFPGHLQAMVSTALPNITVKTLVYPKYETRGDLHQCVQRFRDWLQNTVIDLEVKEGTPAPTIDPSVRIILVGHSMGGIMAAETFLSIVSDTPIHQDSTSTPLPSSTTKSSTTSSSVPPTKVAERSPSPPHSFMFPYIQGVLAFDTPYLGINPGVLAHGAEAQYQQVSGAYQAFSSAASAFGWGGAGTAASTGAKQSAGMLTAGPEAAKEALAASADAAAAPAWQRWGKLAMFAGAAGAVAAGGAAAYVNRGNITAGWSWATSHLEFVGCLMRGEELKTRVSKLIEVNKGGGFGFANVYTQLDRKVAETGTTVAGGFVEIGRTDGTPRTFCNLPTRNDWKGFFEPAVNSKAKDEIGAHMEMFLPRSNPGFYRLAETAKGYIIRWVDDSWYAGSQKRDTEDVVAGEEPVLL